MFLDICWTVSDVSTVAFFTTGLSDNIQWLRFSPGRCLSKTFQYLKQTGTDVLALLALCVCVAVAVQVQRLMFSLRVPILASRCANVSLLQGCKLSMKEYLPMAWQVGQ